MIEISDLHVAFGTIKDPVNAVKGISLEVGPGEVVALVGESGSGKSATAAAVSGLLPVTARTAGSVRVDGIQVIGARPRVMRRLRGRNVSMIFQQAMSALNPVVRVGDQVAEAVRVLTKHGWRRSQQESVELLAQVGLPDPEKCARSFPHELSGGMCQRVMIAIALAGNAPFLIADEPTTALDVTVQAQVLELLRSIIRDRNLGVLLITHDLGVVADIADRVLVMRHGEILERNDVYPFFENPTTQYAQQLVRATSNPMAGIAPPSLARLEMN